MQPRELGELFARRLGRRRLGRGLGIGLRLGRLGGRRGGLLALLLIVSAGAAVVGTIPLAALAGVLLLSRVMPEDRAVTYLGGLVLASVLTAVVIASLLPGRTWLHTLLELRPMEWVGERSYGLYLWHWPVLLLMLAALPAQEAEVYLAESLADGTAPLKQRSA